VVEVPPTLATENEAETARVTPLAIDNTILVAAGGSVPALRPICQYRLGRDHTEDKTYLAD
jgi:hypothetical protein